MSDDDHNTITIAQATPVDVDALMALYDENARWLRARGIPQWEPGRFPRAEMLRRVERGEVYVAWSERAIAGMVSLLEDVDQDLWGDYPGDALYAHTLAVGRAVAGRAIGVALLDFAAGEAAMRGKVALRLDCYAGSQALNAYYQQARFTLRATVASDDYHVSLYEKQVS